MEMEMIFWLISFIVLLVLEFASMALTTIWFAGGALCAFLASWAGASVTVQIVIFAAVSALLLIFTKPLVKKYINKNTIKTNAEGLIGETARVTAEINNELSTGTAVVNGQEWTARSTDDREVIPKGTMVTIREIRGVKLIVENNQ